MISSKSEIPSTCNYKIISIDGKIQKQILPNEIRKTTNSAIINTSSLSSGTYILVISENNETLFSSKFNIVN